MARLVSVVMPCFNPGPMLRPALRSVLRQSYPEIEIILVDNNSTDGSADEGRAMLTEAGRPFTLLACSEQGANHARNLGFSHARGDFVQWMDADDQLSPNKIALQVAALEQDLQVDIAYGDWSSRRTMPGKPDIVDHHKLSRIEDQVLRTLAGVWYPPHLYLLCRAAADRLQAVQAWWPDRTVATDVEYSALAALLGTRFHHVPGAHVSYNIWSDRQTSQGTPYPKRVASLEAIFIRLREFVEAGKAQVALSARHKVLLNQGWDLWRIPPRSVTVEKRGGRRFVARRGADGSTLELRPREAEIVKLMAQGTAAIVSMHHALMLEPRIPDLAGDHVTIVRTIEMLQREGFLERVARPAPGDANGLSQR
jgi:hypothetical protein